MDKMWVALEAYQPYAEKHGFGDEWKRMTTERSAEAAMMAAHDAYWSERWTASLAAYWSSSAAYATSGPPARRRSTVAPAEQAITNITRAIELEHTETA